MLDFELLKKTNEYRRIDTFDFQPGRILARKYEIVSRIGVGFEGEVYLLRERQTGIERAAKFFFPQRNPNNSSLKYYAKKLHKLRDCSILIQYHTQETIRYQGTPVTFLVSDYVEGELLKDFLKRQPGRRLPAFQGLHLLHSLAKGIERIHQKNEYHGDLHTENVIVQKFGLSFELKLIDVFQWRAPRPENIQEDVVDLIKIFYEAIGGGKFYAKQPRAVKEVCCGLKKGLILEKFKTAGRLRVFLEDLHLS